MSAVGFDRKPVGWVPTRPVMPEWRLKRCKWKKLSSEPSSNMLLTRLILIEGLPGSGKTTLARILSHKLKQLKVEVRCFLEDDSPHPARAPWAEDPEVFAKSSVRTWELFTRMAAASGQINIIEGMFFQSTPRLLLQRDMPLERIRMYASQFESRVDPLDPIMIRFKCRDVAKNVLRICAQRGSRWQSYFVRAVTENPYGRRLGLAGLDGAIAFMEAYNSLSETLFADLKMKKLHVDSPDKNWAERYQEIMRFLELPV